MKIILSRKGFDSGYGGFPSPILPDGEMLSIPIPTRDSDIKYNQIMVEQELSYLDLMKQLYGNQIHIAKNGKYHINDISCHLDPDIRLKSYNRLEHWTGIFGQKGAAQSHLENQRVAVGDIFLFFGWFKATEKNGDAFKFISGNAGIQAIFGYLQVGEIYEINHMEAKTWMKYHPHVKREKNVINNDVLYIASNTFSLDKNLNGYGTFAYNDDLRLTKPGLSRSKWNLPEFMKELSISHHGESSWKKDYFQSARIGQEFVFEANEEVENWVKDLVTKSVI